MTTAKSELGASQIKRSRTSSVSYPYHPLEICLRVAEAVKSVGNGRSDVPKSSLAHSLTISEKSSDFAQKIASTKTFGLIQGKSSFLLTETAREYFFPTESEQASKKRCLLKFLATPGAYRTLIERFDGTRPPSIEIMGNILNKEFGIPESWRIRVATQFLKSAQFAGGLTVDGFLRFKATMESLGGEITASTPEADIPQSRNDIPPSRQKPPQNENESPQEGVIVWKYPCGDNFLRLETPENMTKEIWEKLNKYIQVLKP